MRLASGDHQIAQVTRHRKEVAFLSGKRTYLVTTVKIPGVCSPCHRSLRIKRYIADVLTPLPLPFLFALATLFEARPEILERAAELQSQVTAMQEKLQTLLRGIGGLQVVLPELHDETSGRIDAQKLAVYMGVPLKRLAEGLQLNYKAIHRNPSAEAFQPALKPVKRSVEILQDFFHKPETVRVWLNTPHPDLDRQTALEVILANDADAILRILENAASGVPV